MLEQVLYRLSLSLEPRTLDQSMGWNRTLHCGKKHCAGSSKGLWLWALQAVCSFPREVVLMFDVVWPLPPIPLCLLSRCYINVTLFSAKLHEMGP